VKGRERRRPFGFDAISGDSRRKDQIKKKKKTCHFQLTMSKTKAITILCSSTWTNPNHEMTAVCFKAPRKKKYLKTPTQQTKYPTLKKPIQKNKNKIISKSNSQQARQEKKKKKNESHIPF
jgi:hypothetical protein